MVLQHTAYVSSVEHAVREAFLLMRGGRSTKSYSSDQSVASRSGSDVVLTQKAAAGRAAGATQASRAKRKRTASGLSSGLRRIPACSLHVGVCNLERPHHAVRHVRHILSTPGLSLVGGGASSP